MIEYDLVIIGAGPAGMSAALFAEGDRLKFRLAEKGRPCSFVEEAINTNFTNLENYLGLYNINGTEVANIFRQHMESRQIPIHKEDIQGILAEGDLFIVESNGAPYGTRSLILATGTSPRRLTMEGIERVPERVHYGINRNFSEYSGKSVLIVGGRNSGAVAAVRLKEFGANPIIIEKGVKSTTKEKYLEKIRSLSIPYFLNSTLERVVGNSEIEFVDVKIDGKEEQVKPIAIFGCIGYVPNNSLAKMLGLKLDDQGYIEVDRKMQTSRDGVYAAGDVNGGVKMIAVASGEGAIAEYYANFFVRSRYK